MDGLQIHLKNLIFFFYLQKVNHKELHMTGLEIKSMLNSFF